MHAKFACADFTFPLLPHENVLRLIAMLEFTGVDIGLFANRSHLWPSHEFAQLNQAAHRLKSQLDACGLVAADIFLQLDPDFTPYAINHPETMRRQYACVQFARTLEYAAKDNAIDYGRVLHVMRETGYSGWLGIEYVWLNWERCNECDNISETILFRDYLRALVSNSAG
jgi:sugar phosphate isomerase/epimerase